MKRALLIVLTLGTLIGSAEAAPISGSFSKFGNFLPVLPDGSVTTLNQATGIDFIALFGSTPTPGTDGQFIVNAASGDFAYLVAQVGTVKDFSFAGAGSAGFPSLPLTGFESVGGLTFDLLSTSLDLQTANALVLTGTGLFHLAGFDDTLGDFTFTGNASGGTFSFSASQSAQQVPEPATLGFVMSGLIAAMVFHARRRRLKPQLQTMVRR